MNINQIAEHIVGKVIEEAAVEYTDDTLIIYLSDGTSIEIIVDSIYADIPHLDD
jgi:hypothetical protein